MVRSKKGGQGVSCGERDGGRDGDRSPVSWWRKGFFSYSLRGPSLVTRGGRGNSLLMLQILIIISCRGLDFYGYLRCDWNFAIQR